MYVDEGICPDPDDGMVVTGPLCRLRSFGNGWNIPLKPVTIGPLRILRIRHDKHRFR
jgi:hypothetical protein